MVWPRYSLDEEQLFYQLLLPFAIIYYDSHRLENDPEYVCPDNPSESPQCPRGGVKNQLVEFSENIYRENTAFSKDLLFPDSYFFTLQIIVNFWSFAAVMQHLLNSG